MTIEVVELRDPNEAFERARAFLFANPAQNNLPLSILGQSREQGLEGRYWIVEHDAGVVGFALQSPPGMRVVLARMEVGVVRALDRLVGEGAVERERGADGCGEGLELELGEVEHVVGIVVDAEVVRGGVHDAQA